MTTAEQIARTQRRIAAHHAAGITADRIIADHPEQWREYITNGVFSQRRISYETAQKRLAESRARFGDDHYELMTIGFALRFKLYPEYLVA